MKLGTVKFTNFAYLFSTSFLQETVVIWVGEKGKRFIIGTIRANKGVGQEIGVIIVMNRSQNICAFFSLSTKELTRGYFFISPLVYLPLCSRGEIRM